MVTKVTFQDDERGWMEVIGSWTLGDAMSIFMGMDIGYVTYSSAY